jgi:hypothetical protein
LVLLAAGTDAEQAQALAASGVLAHVPALLADRPLVRQVRADRLLLVGWCYVFFIQLFCCHSIYY